MAYTEQLVQAVWEKGRASAAQARDLWRRDQCGAWIRREHYGRTDSEFGWRIENVTPGSPDTLDNLQPLNCANAYDRANQRAHCSLVADLSDVPPAETVLEPRNRRA